MADRSRARVRAPAGLVCSHGLEFRLAAICKIDREPEAICLESEHTLAGYWIPLGYTIRELSFHQCDSARALHINSQCR